MIEESKLIQELEDNMKKEISKEGVSNHDISEIIRKTRRLQKSVIEISELLNKEK